MAHLRTLRNVVGYSDTWKEGAVEHGYLPVYADWMCEYALTRDGEPVYSAEGDWHDPQPLTNQRHRHVVMAQAADRYPELQCIRPQRKREDPVCPSCNGTGKVLVAHVHEPRLICECGGLGWIPAGSVPGPY